MTVIFTKYFCTLYRCETVPYSLFRLKRRFQFFSNIKIIPVSQIYLGKRGSRDIEHVICFVKSAGHLLAGISPLGKVSFIASDMFTFSGHKIQVSRFAHSSESGHLKYLYIFRRYILSAPLLKTSTGSVTNFF